MQKIKLSNSNERKKIMLKFQAVQKTLFIFSEKEEDSC